MNTQLQPRPPLRLPRQTQSAWRVVLAMALWGFFSNALAWGKEGHKVIANLAATQLTVKARGEVERLLALEPGATLQSISTWADEYRNPATGPWHYVNFPRETCT